ncbi:MAG: DNA internalization-related competence protein ComEC/Rec2 [Gammaproteobacteria bacterium]|nr:DNA internalization-related competence protein ComEC/Rec2 [Gammaproteobacteria bacterium]
MRAGTAAFLLGICAFWGLSRLPDWGMFVLILLVPFAVWRKPALRWLAFLAFGFAWAWLTALWGLRWSWPEAEASAPRWLDLHIVDLPSLERGRLSFLARLEAVDEVALPAWRQPLIRLGGEAPLAGLPVAGERWRVWARLRPAHGLLNPGAEDAERRLFEQGIRATGTLSRARPAQRLEAASAWSLGHWRQSLRDRMLAALDERPMAGLVAALVLGDDEAVPDEVWSVYRRTGTAHLVAISGSHITLVAGFVFLPAYFLWRRSARLCLMLPAKVAAASLSLSLVFLYSLLAGFAVPVQRALLMLLVLSLAVVRRRRIAPSAAYCASLLAVLLFDARAVLSPGFWLSFGAVAIILWLVSGRSREPTTRTWLRLQIGISLALLPLTLSLFQQASLISPVANLFAVPWFGFVSMPLGLSGTLLLPIWPDGGAWLLRGAEWSLAVIYPLLRWAAELPFASVQLGGFGWLALVSGLLGLGLCMAPRGFPLRGLGLFLLLPLLGAALAPPGSTPGLHLTVVDVGQGLSVVVETERHVLVYDAGFGEPGGYSAGARAVVPVLRARGHRRIDRLIVSHGDADHAGGVEGLLADMPAAEIVGSGHIRFPDARACRAGEAWTWDGVEFRFLHPDGGAWTGNNGSCVLAIDYQGRRILLTGDIEAKAEKSLLARYGAGLKTDLLVAPHHGSLSSSTPDFLAALRPRWVVFPVGYENRFHFPRERVLARYRRLDSEILRTDRHGAVGFEFRAGEEPRLSRFRAVDARIWRHGFAELTSASLPGRSANVLE